MKIFILILLILFNCKTNSEVKSCKNTCRNNGYILAVAIEGNSCQRITNPGATSGANQTAYDSCVISSRNTATQFLRQYQKDCTEKCGNKFGL